MLSLKVCKGDFFSWEDDREGCLSIGWDYNLMPQLLVFD